MKLTAWAYYKDDSSCLKDEPFALLLHGTQPKGSKASKALQAIKKTKVKA